MIRASVESACNHVFFQSSTIKPSLDTTNYEAKIFKPFSLVRQLGDQKEASTLPLSPLVIVTSDHLRQDDLGDPSPGSDGLLRDGCGLRLLQVHLQAHHVSIPGNW